MRIINAKGIADATMLRVSTSSATNAVNLTLVNTPIAEGTKHATTAKGVVTSAAHGVENQKELQAAVAVTFGTLAEKGRMIL